MREKGHQNWPLVIRPRYDPHLPFSGRSVSKPWSKRDTSSSIPPLREMSVPHCPTAITSCEPGSAKQRPASFSWPAGVQKKKYNTYLWDYLASRVSLLWKKELSQPHRVETCDTRKWFGAVTLLSERRSVYFWQEGETGWTAWKKSNLLFWELTKDAM